MRGLVRKWPLTLPWRLGGAALGHRRVVGTGTGREGPAPALSLISPAYQDAKLENLEGLPAGRLHTARHHRRYLLMSAYRKYRCRLPVFVAGSPGLQEAGKNAGQMPNLRCRPA